MQTLLSRRALIAAAVLPFLVRPGLLRELTAKARAAFAVELARQRR